MSISGAIIINVQLMHNEAVQHRAAQFNSMAGDFEWLDDVAESKEK